MFIIYFIIIIIIIYFTYYHYYYHKFFFYCYHINSSYQLIIIHTVSLYIYILHTYIYFAQTVAILIPYTLSFPFWH